MKKKSTFGCGGIEVARVVPSRETSWTTRTPPAPGPAADPARPRPPAKTPVAGHLSGGAFRRGNWRPGGDDRTTASTVSSQRVEEDGGPCAVVAAAARPGGRRGDDPNAVD
jgi:hypothetical protein